MPKMLLAMRQVQAQDKIVEAKTRCRTQWSVCSHCSDGQAEWLRLGLEIGFGDEQLELLHRQLEMMKLRIV